MSKMAIRPYKVQALINKEGAEEWWKKLETAIDEIYKRNSSALFFEELYRTAYNLVLQKHGDLLYQGVTDCFRSHSEIVCSDVLKVPDSNLLSELCVVWEDNKTTITKIKDIVMYMDRTLVVHEKLVPVYCKGVSVFRECVIYNPIIRDKMHRLILDNILAERNGEIIDTETIKGVLNMLIELGVDGERVYETEFEELFLSATKSFYREEYLLFSAQFSCSEYIKKVEMRFLEEAKRVNRYLSKTTEPKLRAILNSELISDHAESLVEMESSGCRNMMKENQIENLKGIYIYKMFCISCICNFFSVLFK
jgi:cullin 3